MGQKSASQAAAFSRAAGTADAMTSHLRMIDGDERIDRLVLLVEAMWALLREQGLSDEVLAAKLIGTRPDRRHPRWEANPSADDLPRLRIEDGGRVGRLPVLRDGRVGRGDTLRLSLSPAAGWLAAGQSRDRRCARPPRRVEIGLWAATRSTRRSTPASSM